MPDAAKHPLEEILRQCAAAAPNPWFPSAYARDAGVARDSLDVPLNDLRVGGLIHVIAWIQGQGQGYGLTPAGAEVLQNARDLAQIRAGNVPQRAAKPKELSPPAPAAATAWERGEANREVLLNPRPPVVTPALIGLNVAFFAAGLLLALHGGVPLNKYLAGGTTDILESTGALTPLDLVRGQWWRLLTACFVHIGLLHLGVNMYALYVLGPIVERTWGRARFLALYLIAGLGSSCAAMILKPFVETNGGHRIMVQLAGASGAICGIMAALALWVILNRRSLPPQLVSAWLRNIVINFVLITFISMIPGVSGAGHLGGAVAGAIATLLLQSERFGAGWQRLLACLGLLAVPVGCVGWLLYAMSAEPLWHELAKREQLLQADKEVRAFREVVLPPIDDSTKAARMVYYNQADALLARPPEKRPTAEVQQVVAALAEKKSALVRAAELVRKTTPFKDPQLEEARKLGLEYIEAWVKLMELAEEGLHANGDWAAKKEAIDQQKQHVSEIRQRLRGLLQ